MGVRGYNVALLHHGGVRLFSWGCGGRMHVIPNDEPLEEVYCFKYCTLGIKWQQMEDVKGKWYTE